MFIVTLAAVVVRCAQCMRTGTLLHAFVFAREFSHPLRVPFSADEKSAKRPELEAAKAPPGTGDSKTSPAAPRAARQTRRSTIRSATPSAASLFSVRREKDTAPRTSPRRPRVRALSTDSPA